MSSIRLSLVLCVSALLSGAGCGTARPKCLPSNCAGCCSVDGECVVIPTAQACGLRANACVACQADQTCIGGFCGGGATGGGSATGGGGGSATGGGGGSAMGGGGGSAMGGGGGSAMGGGGGSATGGGGGSAVGGGGGSATGGGGGATGAAFFGVIRVGAGTAALTSGSTEVHYERRDLSTGAVAADLPFPTAASGANRAFSVAGTSLTEGALTLSTNNQYALVAGYDSVPGVASINSTAGVPRVVARIDLSAGTIDTGTTINDSFGSASIRSAASVDGSGYWVAGASINNLNAGVRYVVHGATGATAEVSTVVQNTRTAQLYNAQLYASTSSGPAPDGGTELSRIFAIGTGTPLTATSSVTYLPGVNIAGPGNFVLLDQSSTVAGLDTLYVADTTVSGTGARKYTFDGTVWTQAVVFPLVSGTGFQVAAKANGTSSVTVLLTCSQGVLKWDDTGLTGTAPAGTLVSAAPTNSAFRGVVFLP